MEDDATVGDEEVDATASLALDGCTSLPSSPTIGAGELPFGHNEKLREAPILLLPRPAAVRRGKRNVEEVEGEADDVEGDGE